MAPFRRGKSGPRNRSTNPRGASKTGAKGHRGDSRAISAPKTATKNIFQTSRVQELVDGRSESPDSIRESGSPGSQSDELLSHDETSGSDEVPEKPYSVLLRTLNPKLPHNEPRKKRRRLASDTLPAPIQDPDALQDVEDEGEFSEEGSADGSDIVSSQQELDSFTRHFADTDEEETLRKIQAAERNQWTVEKTTASSSWSSTLRRPITSGEAVDDGTNLIGVQNLKLKPKLKSFAKAFFANTDDLTTQLAASMFSYRDVLYSARTLDNADTLRTLTSLHILNHISQTRDRVLRNNAKLSKSSDGEDLELRDQGFTRPKVLVLLPTRQSCVKMVAAMINVDKPEQQGNMKRFEQSYASVDDELSPDKPEDFKDLFGGNDDDMFRLGLKFSRRTVKFFSQFYNSDIIFASPLGLRTVLGGDNKKADHDFLSSIEIVVLDQSEALLMQNWEHVEYIFEHLNLQPKEAHGCDFSRLRSWYLNGHAKYLRQTILFSSFNFPALNKLYTQSMLNTTGKIKFAMVHKGAITDLATSVKQTFSRFDFTDPTSEPDDRFNYFSTAVLPSLIKASSRNVGGHQGILIFMPLYADFVRVRNHLAASSSTQHVSFGSVSEYTPVKEVARARSHFLSGRHSMLLYTERAHHFRRYRLKGISRIIFYGLPENPLFYREIIFFMTMLAIHKKDRHSDSLDGRLDLFEHGHLTLSHMIRQQPIGAEEIWDSYFDGDGFVYEGLNLDLIQDRVVQSDTRVPLNNDLYPSREHHSLDLTVGERPGVDFEDSLLKEHQLTELPTSNIPLRNPMFSLGDEFGDMNKCSGINRASSHDRELSGDTCCPSLSGSSPDKSTLRGFKTQDEEGHDEEKDTVAAHETSKQQGFYIDNHSQKTLLETLNQETEDLLRTPLTPMSSEIVSEHGFPLGVEVARNAYGQGLLSTEAFYRDCLPPALSVLKPPSSSDQATENHDSSTVAYQSSGGSLSPSPGRRQTGAHESKPVLKRRNLSHDAQIRRIDQAPLSAIHEEPAGSQHACTCGLCSDSDSGRGIVWFHLCPRYAAIARENGVTYEPCEGRIIMHHGPDRSSVGLIIEGPMEDRFLPAIRPPRLPVAPEPDEVQSPKSGKLDLRAMHSATGRSARTLPRTTSGPKLHQLPPISTPALQRPISPATQVSYPTSLNPLYSVYCPKQEKDDCARDASHSFQGIMEQFPATPSANPQGNVHPAFRTEGTLPREWSGSPSRKPSHASIQDEKFECPQTPDSESLRRSSNYSDFSAGRPARSDSLGAPSHRGLCKEEEKSSIDQPLKTGRAPTHSRARHLALSSSSASVLSPFASHERTPSVFLGPSTPSTASFQRSSMSSYGDPLPSHIHELEEAATPADTKENRLASPFQSRHHSMNYAADADAFSPRLSYHTAPNSHYAYSPPVETPQTPRTSISSLDRLRSHNPRQNSPFFETQGYLRYQASEHSFAQTLDSLQIQRDDGITSSTNLLNGRAFDNVDSRSEDSGCRNEGDNADYDCLYILDGGSDHQSNHSADPLETVGATEAHCTNIVTSRKKPIQEETANTGLGISNSTLTLQQPTPKPRSPLPHPGSNATNEQLESYISNKISSTQQRRTEPLRRSLVVQQNLCSHTKLQHMLGIESSSPSTTGNHRSRSPKNNTQSPSMTMNEVLSPLKKENDRLGFVKKGSLLFREKRTNLTGKVKAGWKVRPEDWQDDDDRN